MIESIGIDTTKSALSQADVPQTRNAASGLTLRSNMRGSRPGRSVLRLPAGNWGHGCPRTGAAVRGGGGGMRFTEGAMFFISGITFVMGFLVGVLVMAA